MNPASPAAAGAAVAKAAPANATAVAAAITVLFNMISLFRFGGVALGPTPQQD
jgi:hypothetical protein